MTSNIRILAELEFQKLGQATPVTSSWPRGFEAGYKYRDPEIAALNKYIDQLERMLKNTKSSLFK